MLHFRGNQKIEFNVTGLLRTPEVRLLRKCLVKPSQKKVAKMYLNIVG